MKVSELKKILETLDPNTEIILSCDKEGNSYRKLLDIDEGTIAPGEIEHYYIDHYYSNATLYDGLTDEERAKLPKVICLWP